MNSNVCCQFVFSSKAFTTPLAAKFANVFMDELYVTPQSIFSSPALLRTLGTVEANFLKMSLLDVSVEW